MLEYLQKYSQLPLSLRQQLASPKIVGLLKILENAYGVKLSAFVIKILVGEISIDQGAVVLSKDFNLSQAQASNLMAELKNKILILNTPTNISEVRLKIGNNDQAPEEEIIGTDLEKKLNEVMATIKVDFASQALAERFKKIILTHLKGIRNRISVKEALSKPVENGGLGFDLNSAEAILRLIKQEPAGLIKRPVSWNQNLVDKAPIARDAEYDLAASLKARQGEERSEEKLLAPLTPVVAKTIPQAKPIIAPELPTKLPKAEPLEQFEPKEPINNWRRTESGKIKMDDILTAPRVFTPIDEIKYMTIKNFRNLSQDSDQAIAIIKQKIEALANEDFSKKVAGIQGWRVSPVNRMYVETYQEAINTGKGITAILNKNKKLNPEFITEAEFEAILTLNQDLKSMLQ